MSLLITLRHTPALGPPPHSSAHPLCSEEVSVRLSRHQPNYRISSTWANRRNFEAASCSSWWSRCCGLDCFAGRRCLWSNLHLPFCVQSTPHSHAYLVHRGACYFLNYRCDTVAPQWWSACRALGIFWLGFDWQVCQDLNIPPSQAIYRVYPVQTWAFLDH